MKISVITFSFHKLFYASEMDMNGYLDTIKDRYHLPAADIWDGSLESIEEDYLLKVKSALAERELVLANLAVDGAHPWDPDPEVRENNHQKLLKYLKAAEILGAGTVRIDFGVRDTELSEEQFDVLARRYGEYARHAADHGYRIGPENHFGPALDPNVMEKIQKAVDNPAYGILLHVGRWLDGRENEGDTWAAPFTMHTHFFPGLGDQLEAKVRLLKDAGYQGYWGVESVPKGEAIAEIADQISNLSDALARVGV